MAFFAFKYDVDLLSKCELSSLPSCIYQFVLTLEGRRISVRRIWEVVKKSYLFYSISSVDISFNGGELFEKSCLFIKI